MKCVIGTKVCAEIKTISQCDVKTFTFFKKRRTNYSLVNASKITLKITKKSESRIHVLLRFHKKQGKHERMTCFNMINCNILFEMNRKIYNYYVSCFSVKINHLVYFQFVFYFNH